ncbi:hypothetical protein DFH07DRAFT_771025 [Mycena maculata]|uniref:Uncharacterized protein n=1 Tax=Mycena maculata TaxID=230809 RepID=A0AAD7NIQ0_9AGAR|nr:hypothetical protein DFH07DRAFT_771025 [Mycena maculata]
MAPTAEMGELLGRLGRRWPGLSSLPAYIYLPGVKSEDSRSDHVQREECNGPTDGLNAVIRARGSGGRARPKRAGRPGRAARREQGARGGTRARAGGAPLSEQEGAGAGQGAGRCWRLSRGRGTGRERVANGLLTAGAGKSGERRWENEGRRGSMMPVI